jgi:hypothetical protein
MSKTKRGHYYKKKKSTRTRYSKNRVIRKKVSNTLIGGGQIEQDAFINSTFEKIKGKHIDELLLVMRELCLEFKTNIVETEKYEFTVNITSYLVTSILVPFFMKYKIYTFEDYPYSKVETLRHLHLNNVFLGSVIKQHDLTSLTPYPEKSFGLLNSCNDDEYYCIMYPSYLIIDYKKVEYYCNSDDPNKIKRITNSQDLSEVENGSYLYCILPNGTLCLFRGNHSAGACGQPVICAGNIKISDKKIQIDNSSGHYSPPSSMLNKAMDVLKTKGIIESYVKKDEIIKGGEIKVFELTKSE